MYSAILLLPLLGAVIAGFFHRQIGEKGAMYVSTGILIFCAVLSWIAFFSLGEPGSVELFRWIGSGDLQAYWSIRVDRLTCVMLVVVTTVSALVHVYSIGYTDDGDHPDPIDNFQGPARSRFFAYLSFFTFAMLALVTGDNLLQIFFGWEGVGVASYLLIGFWYKKGSANAAAIKAFVVNRVGDFGFLLGMFGLFYLTGSIMLDDVFAEAGKLAAMETTFLGYHVPAIELICILLFVGACGKSAQFLLHCLCRVEQRQKLNFSDRELSDVRYQHQANVELAARIAEGISPSCRAARSRHAGPSPNSTDQLPSWARQGVRIPATSVPSASTAGTSVR